MARIIALVLLLSTGACWTSNAPTTPHTEATEDDGPGVGTAIGVAAFALLGAAIVVSATHDNDPTTPAKSDPCDDLGRAYDPNPEEHPCR